MVSKRMKLFSLVISVTFSICIFSIVRGQEYSSVVKVAEIRLFKGKGADEVPPKNQRIYSTQFPKSTTQIIYCQVEFINPLFDVEEHSYQVGWEYLNPDGSLFKELHSEFNVGSTTYIASYVKGIGWSEPGGWSLGTYTVRVYIEGKEVGEKQFTVYDDILPESMTTGMELDAPLDKAVYEGQTATVEALLREGADPNVKHMSGGYPLVIAILRDHADIVRLLLDHGADIRVKDEKGRSAAMLAKFKQNKEIMSLFERAEKASVKGVWDGKWTSLTEYLYSFTMNLTIGMNNKVEATIEWTLKYTPQSDENLKVGLKATEYVSGSYNPDTREVTLNGIRENDPYAIINVSNYQLILLSDSQTLHGKAHSDRGETQISANRRK